MFNIFKKPPKQETEEVYKLCIYYKGNIEDSFSVTYKTYEEVNGVVWLLHDALEEWISEPSKGKAVFHIQKGENSMRLLLSAIGVFTVIKQTQIKS